MPKSMPIYADAGCPRHRAGERAAQIMGVMRIGAVSGAELRDVGFAAPDAERCRLHRELARAVRGLVVDDGAVGVRIFEHHALMTLEIEEIAARGRVPAGAEHDTDLALFEEIPGAHDV